MSLPPQLLEHAREFAEGSRQPAEPRDAATVVVMRPSDAGPELYLLRRQTSMAFAGGMCAFPGGGVDPRDFDTAVAWSGPSPAAWAERLQTSPELARALVCAAVRETFEESGVLLAGPSAAEVVADPTGDDWEADRRSLETRELALTEFLDRRGLVLRTDLLGAWAAWCTPEFEPRRFRTWFFVASLPPGQRTRDVSTESSSVLWMPALVACDAVDAQEIGMMPPTYVTCLEVGQYADPLAVLAAAPERDLTMFTPSLDPDDRVSIPARSVPLVEARGG
ncbi:MAG TPA: NUDIX hydrolase [Nocardioides sp.]|uniref:NUDIX hydrolase n=1 Tax=Nocardioides sp. TaxID=35761 RepID=UPI002E31A902|nr:NUDIX hydrolase [Nocardioides sp.]HEX3932415.1 NUDIX hydrolase [Nocardioides sp.]